MVSCSAQANRPPSLAMLGDGSHGAHRGGAQARGTRPLVADPSATARRDRRANRAPDGACELRRAPGPQRRAPRARDGGKAQARHGRGLGVGDPGASSPVTWPRCTAQSSELDVTRRQRRRPARERAPAGRALPALPRDQNVRPRAHRARRSKRPRGTAASPALAPPRSRRSQRSSRLRRSGSRQGDHVQRHALEV